MRPTTFARSAGLLAGFLLLIGGPAARADQIDRALAQHAGKVAHAARSLGADAVAVLKFQVQIGTDSPTFHAGTMGADMVNRIQNVLLLTADPADPKPVVLVGAGDEAAKLAKSSGTTIDWATANGRAKLFGMKLPPMWGDADKLAPDGFITGTVRVSADLKDVYVDLVGFTKSDPTTLRPLLTLDGSTTGGDPKPIRTDRGILTGLGKTFTLPPKLPAGRSRHFAPDDAAVDDAARRHVTRGGAASAENPVKLNVFYDGKLVSPEPDPVSPGEFRIPSPRSGQKVKFELTNTSPDRVAVLLTVNGKNTIATEKEDLSAPGVSREKFRTWVLEPDPAKKYTIVGFLEDYAGTVRPFSVLSEEASTSALASLSSEYGGKIHMIVYGKRPKLPPLPPVNEPSDPDDGDPVAVENVPVDTTPADPAPVARPTPPDPEVSNPSAHTEEKPENGKGQGPKLLDSASDDIRELNEGIDAGGLVTVTYSSVKSRDLANAQATLTKKLQLAAKPDGRLASIKPKAGKGRGLLGGDTATTSAGPVDQVKFDYDPLPIGSMVISYYGKK